MTVRALRLAAVLALALAASSCRSPSDHTWIGGRLRAEAAADQVAPPADARNAPQR